MLGTRKLHETASIAPAANLQQMLTEYTLQRMRQLCMLGGEQCGSQRRLQPGRLCSAVLRQSGHADHPSVANSECEAITCKHRQYG